MEAQLPHPVRAVWPANAWTWAHPGGLAQGGSSTPERFAWGCTKRCHPVQSSLAFHPDAVGPKEAHPAPAVVELAAWGAGALGGAGQVTGHALAPGQVTGRGLAPAILGRSAWLAWVKDKPPDQAAACGYRSHSLQAAQAVGKESSMEAAATMGAERQTAGAHSDASLDRAVLRAVGKGMVSCQNC